MYTCGKAKEGATDARAPQEEDSSHGKQSLVFQHQGPTLAGLGKTDRTPGRNG